MHLRQAILPGAVQLFFPVSVLVLGDHLLAAAGITSEGEAGERCILRENTAAYQRLHQGNESAGMTAGNSDILAIFDCISVFCREFREAIGPSIGDSMGSRGIQDAGIAAFCQLDRLSGGCIRQAENGDISAANTGFTGLRILSS